MIYVVYPDKCVECLLDYAVKRKEHPHAVFVKISGEQWIYACPNPDDDPVEDPPRRFF